jgi:serpin B
MAVMLNHNRLWITLLGCLLLGSLAASACGDGGPPGAASIVEARSDKERIAEPNVTEADLAELVTGNTEFALDLYRLLSEEDGNLFFSPYSISAALAMTYAGARGDTESEMAGALSFLLTQDRLHPAFNALDLALTAEPELTEDQTGDPLEISIANALWAEQTYEFLPAFLDLLAENYDAGLNLVDFITAYEDARHTINAWVSDQTADRIPELLEEGTLNMDTRLVLTNAIYFRASWLNPFDAADTQDGAFHLLDGSEVQAPMMHLDERMPYANVAGTQVARVPYEGFSFSMYVILPPEHLRRSSTALERHSSTSRCRSSSSTPASACRTR